MFLMKRLVDEVKFNLGGRQVVLRMAQQRRPIKTLDDINQEDV